MKKDVHFKLDEGQILELKALAETEGLPFVRFIETAVREYLEHIGAHRYYRVTAVSEVTGQRMAVTARTKTKDDAVNLLNNLRNPKLGWTENWKRPQIERVTL